METPKFNHSTLEGIEAHEKWVLSEIDRLRGIHGGLIDVAVNTVWELGDDAISAVATDAMEEQSTLETQIQEVQSKAFIYFAEKRKRLK